MLLELTQIVPFHTGHMATATADFYIENINKTHDVPSVINFERKPAFMKTF